jgi:hypothetical protein
MSIQIEYTPEGDLLIRCGAESMVWPLATAPQAAGAVGSPAVPAAPTAPATTADPHAPTPPIAPPPKPPKIGYPPPLPGVMTIVSRRPGGIPNRYPWFAADWSTDPALELPLAQLQNSTLASLRAQVQVMVARSTRAGRCLTVNVQPSFLQAPLDISQLQQLADDPQLGLEGVRLQFGPPDNPVHR